MNTTISPNMLLPIPVVGVDPGPDWANNVNACLSAIDSHNHSSGQGVQITPDGLNISSDLAFGGNNATTLRSLRLSQQSVALATASDLDCLYDVTGDLYFNDGAGNHIRITQGGNVVGSSGTITGLPSGTASASFAAGTFTWQSSTSTPANMAVGPLIIGAQVANSKTVTLAPPNTLAANYSLTFPGALPGATSLTTIDTSGNIATTTTPTITGGAFSGTITGSPTFSGNPTFSGTPVFSNPIGLVVGAVGAPSIFFGTDTNTGIYHPAANQVAITLNGTQSALISTDGFKTSSGTTSLPAYSFLTETDTGLSNIVVNSFSAICGGAEVVRFSPSGMEFVESATELGFFKVKTFSASFSSVAGGAQIATLAAPSGVILAVSGYYTSTSAPNGQPIPPSNAAAGINFTGVSPASTSQTILINGFGTSQTGTYKVVMIYQ